jgi:hypothetical protein
MKVIKVLILFSLCLATAGFLFGADKDAKKLQKPVSVYDDPIQPINSKWHYIGRLWSRVTNFGKTGDDAYEARTPSGDWPNDPAQYPTPDGDFPSDGRSANSYLYRGSLWLSAKVDGEPHVTEPEDSEYSPLDSVHAIYPGDRAQFETYTKYYDVKVPGAAGHFPLGLEITERTFSWPESYRYDFIIYEYTIKNVGIDSDNDGIPDTPRDLEEFYFTFRMDGDVSKLSDWPAEGPYSNEDDLAGINVSWDFIDLFDGWSDVDHGLTPENADTSIMFMFDADNPSVPSEYQDPETGQFVENDLGNPGPEGTLQTPGFLGYKVLKTQPSSFRVSKFRTGHIYNDPVSDAEAYERMVAPNPGEDPFEEQGPSGVVINPSTGDVFPLDYRGFMTLGPIENFKAGDSVVVTTALGVGADQEKGGIYSLMKLVQIMDVAQKIVDNDYDWDLPVPPAPSLELGPYYESPTDRGVAIQWSNDSESFADFLSYVITKASEKNADQSWNFDTLAVYEKDENGNWITQPPAHSSLPGWYEFRDPDVINGFDYAYGAEGLGTSDFPGYEIISAGKVTSAITPSNPPTNSLDRIKVVPNPYLGSAAWNNPSPSDASAWEHKLQFTNLPADATVKIFTVDGDYVDEVRAGDSVRGGDPGSSVAEWDLITRNNQDAAPGIYLYVVQSPSLGEKVGKFVIVR